MSFDGTSRTSPPPGAVYACSAADRWFRDEAGAKFFWNGITYGPFKPNTRGEPWPEDERLRIDFAHIASLGFNTVRVYDLPTDEVLKACASSGLRLLAGAPWTQHIDIFTDHSAQRDAITRVAQAARRLAHERCIAGLLIGNEIDKALVRWMGAVRVRDFLEELIAAAKSGAPKLPAAYANYPSTEYLVPRNADFLAFNVFLERRDDFTQYLNHLQVIAGDRPLVITEFGLDTKQHGEAAQAETLHWEMAELRRAGAAGNFWFSYTDEWHRGGEEVTGWDFGVVTRERKPKQVCAQLPLNSSLSVHQSSLELSAIVCTRNGAATLRECLAALARQSHSRFEVLVIDDGSNDATPEIAREFSFVKYHRQDHAGLSAARNLGSRLAQCGIVAFTDDDCVPDEDWLHNLAAAFEDADCVAAGGPNLPPLPRTRTEAVVALAPGAPAHVLSGDLEAEHLPGCNLAIRKSALEAIGGFRGEFAAAGDDVDVCWRLQAGGGKLHFVPSAVVWHHRRATVAAYLRQQRGYGSAEAQLIKHWPERFAWTGGARWRGAIYGQAQRDDLAGKLIDFGPGGSALFPVIYATHSRRWLDWFSGLPCALVIAALLGAGIFFKPLLFIAAALLGGTIIAAVSTAQQRIRVQKLPSLRGRIILTMLCWLQPLVRDWARLCGMIELRAWPKNCSKGVPSLPEQGRVALAAPSRFGSRVWSFWNQAGENDVAFIAALKDVCADAGTSCVPVVGPGNEWDFKLKANGITVFIALVTEYYEGGGRMVRVRCSRPWHWNYTASRYFHSLLHRAAERCGWLDKGRSRTSRDSPLASLPASVKLPEQIP